MNDAAGNAAVASHSPLNRNTDLGVGTHETESPTCEAVLRQPRPIPACLLPVLIIITLTTGTGIVLLQKFMNRQSVIACPGCPARKFASPMGQTLAMFAGRKPKHKS